MKRIVLTLINSYDFTCSKSCNDYRERFCGNKVFLGVFLNGGIIGGFAKTYMFGSTLGIYEKSADLWISLPLE